MCSCDFTPREDYVRNGYGPSHIYAYRVFSARNSLTRDSDIHRRIQKVDLGGALLGPSPALPSLPPSLPFPLPPQSLPLRLEVGPLIQLGDLGERCKLPQWGLGRSPSRQKIWCISGPKGAALVVTVLWIFMGINLIFWCILSKLAYPLPRKCLTFLYRW